MPRQKMPKVNAQRPKPKPQPFSLTPADLARLEKFACPNCSGVLFQRGVFLLELPMTHPGNHTSKAHTLPTDCFFCVECGTVVKSLI
jgi:hypothetical protein